MHEQIARGHSLTQCIDSPASVNARVLGQTLHNVQSYESKVVSLSEAGSTLDGHVVVVPLHFHGCVRHRDETTFEVGALTWRDNGEF